MRTGFLFISVLRVASGPKVKLAGCESAYFYSRARPPPPSLPTIPVPVVYSTERSKAVVLVLRFVALWFILQGDLF